MSTVNFQTDTDVQVFDHGPTDLPPRQYLGGPDAHSPWKPRKNLGTIPGSALDYVSAVSHMSVLSCANMSRHVAPCARRSYQATRESSGRVP
jgi:hypothetical protein